MLKGSRGDLGVGCVQVEECPVERSYGSHALFICEHGGECGGDGTNLVLCTLGIQHGDQHVTVAVAFGPVCAKDLPETRGRGLEVKVREW